MLTVITLNKHLAKNQEMLNDRNLLGVKKPRKIGQNLSQSILLRREREEAVNKNREIYI